jgi:hypothetical protein
VLVLVVLPLYSFLLSRDVPSFWRVAVLAARHPFMSAVVSGVVANLTSRTVTNPWQQLMIGSVAGGLCYVILARRALMAQLPARLLPARFRDTPNDESEEPVLIPQSAPTFPDQANTEARNTKEGGHAHG